MREFLAKLRAGIEPPPPRTDANRVILQAARQEVQRERGQEQAVPSAAPLAAGPKPQEEPLIQAVAAEALGAAEAEPEAERGTGPVALTPPAPEVSGAPLRRPQKRARDSSALVPAGSAPAVSTPAGVSPEYFAQWWEEWAKKEATSRACRVELAQFALARERREAEHAAAAEDELGPQCRKCSGCRDCDYGFFGTSEALMCTLHSEAFKRVVERRRAADLRHDKAPADPFVSEPDYACFFRGAISYRAGGALT
jgi:hypothetical protein